MSGGSPKVIKCNELLKAWTGCEGSSSANYVVKTAEKIEAAGENSGVNSRVFTK